MSKHFLNIYVSALNYTSVLALAPPALSFAGSCSDLLYPAGLDCEWPVPFRMPHGMVCDEDLPWLLPHFVFINKNECFVAQCVAHSTLTIFTSCHTTARSQYLLHATPPQARNIHFLPHRSSSQYSPLATSQQLTITSCHTAAAHNIHDHASRMPIVSLIKPDQ